MYNYRGTIIYIVTYWTSYRGTGIGEYVSDLQKEEKVREREGEGTHKRCIQYPKFLVPDWGI